VIRLDKKCRQRYRSPSLPSFARRSTSLLARIEDGLIFRPDDFFWTLSPVAFMMKHLSLPGATFDHRPEGKHFSVLNIVHQPPSSSLLRSRFPPFLILLKNLPPMSSSTLCSIGRSFSDDSKSTSVGAPPPLPFLVLSHESHFVLNFDVPPLLEKSPSTSYSRPRCFIIRARPPGFDPTRYGPSFTTRGGRSARRRIHPQRGSLPYSDAALLRFVS